MLTYYVYDMMTWENCSFAGLRGVEAQGASALAMSGTDVDPNGFCFGKPKRKPNETQGNATETLGSIVDTVGVWWLLEEF